MGNFFNRNNDNAVQSNANSIFKEFGYICPSLPPRLLKELRILTQDATVQTYFRYERPEPGQQSNLYHIYGRLLPQTPPYDNGSYKVCIVLSPKFPFERPTLNLLTYIFHPTVGGDPSKPEFGCADCCTWECRPTATIAEWIKDCVDIIDQPDLSYKRCAHNDEAKRLYCQDRASYEARALEMVRDYSCPR